LDIYWNKENVVAKQLKYY